MKIAGKLTAVALALAMLLSASACATTNTPQTQTTAAPATEAPATAAPETEAATTAAPPAEETTASPAEEPVTEAPVAEEATTEAAAETPVVEEPVDIMQPFSRYPETVKITTGRHNNVGGQFAEGQTSQDNAYLDLIKEVLNVEYVVEFDVPGGDYDQTLLLRAASDTLPDTFAISNQARSMTLFQNLVDAGKLADLTPAYNASIGGMTKQYMTETNMDEILRFMTVDGKIYAAQGGQEGYNTAVLWIRQDWLDKLGLEAPKTLEELTTVAQAFSDGNPGGQDNTIGICFNPDSNGGMFGQWFGLLPVFNSVGAYPDIWIDDGAGGVVYGGVQPEIKTALGVLAGWVESGVFDRSMLTMKNGDETRDTYVSTNACGIVFNAWWDPWVAWNGYGEGSVDKDQGKIWTPLLAPLNGDGKFSPKKETVIPGGQAVLSSCANPEAIIKTMNLLQDCCTYRNPEFADLYDKYIKPLEGISDMRTNNPLFYGLLSTQSRIINAGVINDYLATDVLTLDPRTSGDADNIRGAYIWAKNNDMDIWYGLTDDEKTDDLKSYYMYEYAGHWAFDVIGNLYLNGINSGVFAEKDQAFIGTTDAMLDYWQMMFDLQNTAYMQIISGEKPLDYFDEFVNQWNQLGGETITAEVNALIKG